MAYVKKIKNTYEQYGGKSNLARWIVSHFPEHEVYLEPFCGSCSVLFVKPKSFVEIVNDLDDRIINMFTMIRSEPEQLAALLWATPYTAANWREHKVSDDALDDARLLMAQKQWYCGNGNTSTWALEKGGLHKPKPEVWADWFQRIVPAAARLRTVQLLHEDAIKAIGRVSHMENALIYVDPPYFGHEDHYRFGVDYQAMVNVLKEAKAKVVVSEYATADHFWEGWRRIETITSGRARTGWGMAAKENTEVLFMNFPEPLE